MPKAVPYDEPAVTAVIEPSRALVDFCRVKVVLVYRALDVSFNTVEVSELEPDTLFSPARM